MTQTPDRGRHVYEAVVPWWEAVARGEIPDDVSDVSDVSREFAQILSGMTKIVFSRTLAATNDRVVIRDDLAAQLTALKERDGRDIVLSCGPAALAPLAATPGHRPRPTARRQQDLRRRLRRPAPRDTADAMTTRWGRERGPP